MSHATTEANDAGPYTVPLRILKLYCDARYTHTGSHLRGAILRHVGDDPRFHNHTQGPAFLPEVRYVVRDDVPHLVTLGGAYDAVFDITNELQELPAPGHVYQITGREIIDAPVQLGVVDDLLTYRTRTPWLALNQRNHERFIDCRDDAQRRDLLAHVLTGNFLVTLRQCHVELASHERILLTVQSFSQRPIQVRGQTFLGFHVRVVTNLAWTPWLCVGKQAAKGFGGFEEVR